MYKKYWLKGGILGGLTGLLIWLYDYDFLLNMGGPNTPISNFIRSMFNIIPWSGGAAFFPLYILIPIGGLLGIILGWLYGKLKNKLKKL